LTFFNLLLYKKIQLKKLPDEINSNLDPLKINFDKPHVFIINGKEKRAFVKIQF